MALIKCPECGKEISNKAPSCIHCGFPISEAAPTEEVTRAANTHSTSCDAPPPQADAGEPSSQPLGEGKKAQRKRPLKTIAIIAVAVVAIVLLVSILKPWQTPTINAVKEIVSGYGLTVEQVELASVSGGETTNVKVTVSASEIKQEDFYSIKEEIIPIFTEKHTTNVVLTIYGKDGSPIRRIWGDNLGADKNVDTSAPEGENNTATQGGTGFSKYAKPHEDDTSTQDESKKIWNRTESAVVSSLRSTLSTQALYDHEFSIENYETGEGTLYSITMDGYGTGVGYMWMTDTVNGGKKPTVICENIYDSVNATAFSMASIALVKECGGYSLSTAQSKFGAIYDAAPTNGNTIETAVDGTGYTLTIRSGTTLFTAQKP